MPERGRWRSRLCSRGARFALFVDSGAEARALLRANIEALALGGVTRIWRADATKLGSAPAGGPFALAFLDPPYGQGLAGPALASLVEGSWLEPNALCVVEEDAKVDIIAPIGLARVDERIYGDTMIAIFRAGIRGDMNRCRHSEKRHDDPGDRRAPFVLLDGFATLAMTSETRIVKPVRLRQRRPN